MKTKSFGIFSVAVAMMFGGAANANLIFDIYGGATYGIGAHTLLADDNDVSKSAQAYGAIFGVDIPLFRLELEYNYLDSDKLTTNLGMVNAYFKVPTPLLKPYIGAGVGTTFDGKYMPVKSVDVDTDDVIAYQGMLGLTLNLPVLPFNVDVEGRVLYAPDMFRYENNDVDLLQYDARIKLRYVF